MKPLAGKSVLVTRPLAQAGGMVAELESLGAAVYLMPVIEILPTESTEGLDDALRHLDRYDWVVLTSVNGVKALESRMRELDIPVELLREKKLAAIGPATAQELEVFARKPDLVPLEFISEAIADSLGDVRGQRFLLARADIARKDLAILLKNHGATVEEVAVYRIVRGDGSAQLPQQAPDYITLTSSSGVLGTFDILREKGLDSWMNASSLICIGPVTAGTVLELGFRVAAEAAEYTAAGLIRALVGHATRETSHA